MSADRIQIYKKGVIIVCGATASSKTKLAVSLAEQLHTEVISADSMLVYKRLNIGTAKPTQEEMRGIPHHMIDVAEPKDNFSVGDYRLQAMPIIERLQNEEKTPIICGGTGFYIESLLYNSAFGNVGENREIREKYESIITNYGKIEGARRLHDLLAAVDPESANILHENDVKRVIRALEIYEQTGKKKSEQNDIKKPIFPFIAISVEYPREILYERINSRVEKMFSSGLVDEIESLLKEGITNTNQCMQGIGYKEYLEGKEKGDNLSEIKETIKQHTRNYAKRQITFFKRMPNMIKLSPESLNVDLNLESIKEILKSKATEYYV